MRKWFLLNWISGDKSLERLNGKKWTFRSQSALHKVVLIHRSGLLEQWTIRQRSVNVLVCNLQDIGTSWWLVAIKRDNFAKDSLILDHRLWKHGNK